MIYFLAPAYNEHENLPILASSIHNTLKKGYKLIVWTVNDIEEARLLAQAGVYGLISDRPDQLIKEFKSNESNSGRNG